ncbi:MAG TPA: hypothetical protein VKA53_01690, partial [Thermoanaerobaculia bacterium]|nr:hypothetical protein [Thermoanaerobaculia bacterium]
MSSTRVAIVNPQTLLGKEVQDVLEPRLSSEVTLELYTTGTDEDSLLTEIQGEAALIQPWDETSMEDVVLAFLCGSFSEVKRVSEHLPAGCTGVVLAPGSGSEIGRPVVAGVNDHDLETGGVYVSPHPGAVALALLLSGLAPLGVEDAAATVVQPVSIYDERGLESLFEETRSLLNFRESPAGSPFPAQAAFNVYPAGPDMPSLAPLVLDIVGGLRPKVNLLQGGIFHGLAVSLYVKLGTDAEEGKIASVLA